MQESQNAAVLGGKVSTQWDPSALEVSGDQDTESSSSTRGKKSEQQQPEESALSSPTPLISRKKNTMEPDDVRRDFREQMVSLVKESTNFFQQKQDPAERGQETFFS